MADRKRKLERLRDELEVRVERYRAHRERRGGSMQTDVEDASSELANEGVIEALQREAEEELRQVMHALSRLEAGEGEVCERCGEPIGDGRLEALPHTTLCLVCAQRG